MWNEDDDFDHKQNQNSWQEDKYDLPDSHFDNVSDMQDIGHSMRHNGNDYDQDKYFEDVSQNLQESQQSRKYNFEDIFGDVPRQGVGQSQSDFQYSSQGYSQARDDKPSFDSYHELEDMSTSRGFDDIRTQNPFGESRQVNASSRVTEDLFGDISVNEPMSEQSFGYGDNDGQNMQSQGEELSLKEKLKQIKQRQAQIQSEVKNKVKEAEEQLKETKLQAKQEQKQAKLDAKLEQKQAKEMAKQQKIDAKLQAKLDKKNAKEQKKLQKQEAKFDNEKNLANQQFDGVDMTEYQEPQNDRVEDVEMLYTDINTAQNNNNTAQQQPQVAQNNTTVYEDKSVQTVLVGFPPKDEMTRKQRKIAKKASRFDEMDLRNYPMTVGKWIGTYIVLAIPLINIIAIICWFFGVGNKSRSAWIRSFVVVTLIIVIILGALLGAGYFLISQKIQAETGTAPTPNEVLIYAVNSVCDMLSGVVGADTIEPIRQKIVEMLGGATDSSNQANTDTPA